jgi:hypothetical protein
MHSRWIQGMRLRMALMDLRFQNIDHAGLDDVHFDQCSGKGNIQTRQLLHVWRQWKRYCLQPRHGREKSQGQGVSGKSIHVTRNFAN